MSVIDRSCPIQPDWQNLVPDRPAWQVAAACRGLHPDLFHPLRGEPTDAAKAVCVICPVTAECLDFALANNEKFGIWGGKSERERRRLRRPQPVRPMVKICPCCGDTFRPSAKAHRFCSADCRTYYRRTAA